MTKIQSVDKDKYMLRFDTKEMRSATHEAASKEHMTMNTWVQLAIQEKLDRGARMDYLLDLAEKALDKNAK